MGKLMELMKKPFSRIRRGRTGFRWVLIASMAFLIGAWWADTESASQKNTTVGIQETDAQVQAGTKFVCPMMCVPPADHSGKCPVCGMSLTPAGKLPQESNAEGSILELSSESVRLAEIVTAPVERRFVTTDIRLFGRIEYDPVELYKVSAFAPGVIDRIYVRRAGQAVRNGDPLFDIYSSDLFYMEQDLFEVLKDLPYKPGLYPTKGQTMRRYMRPPSVNSFVRPEPSDDPEEQARQKEAWEKYEKIRRKLALLGLDEKAIDLVVARGHPTGISTVITPTSGIVIEQDAFKGKYVNTGETIFSIGNPSYMWARLDAYESDFGWLRIGQDADFETDAYPGEVFRGRIQYLDPEFEAETRTFEVGVLYTDPKSRLKPNMLVRCVVHARMTADGVGIPGGSGVRERAPLVIPDTAPLLTGERAIVYVADPDKTGVYEGRTVLLGPRARGYYIVKKGLKKGELVVVNGAFKIDSAVQILAESSMMEFRGGEGSALAHHDHGGTSTMPAAYAPPDETEIDGRRKAAQGSSNSRSHGYEQRLKELMEKRQGDGTRLN